MPYTYIAQSRTHAEHFLLCCYSQLCRIVVSSWMPPNHSNIELQPQRPLLHPYDVSCWTFSFFAAMHAVLCMPSLAGCTTWPLESRTLMCSLHQPTASEATSLTPDAVSHDCSTTLYSVCRCTAIYWVNCMLCSIILQILVGNNDCHWGGDWWPGGQEPQLESKGNGIGKKCPSHHQPLPRLITNWCRNVHVDAMISHWCSEILWSSHPINVD